MAVSRSAQNEYHVTATISNNVDADVPSWDEWLNGEKGKQTTRSPAKKIVSESEQYCS